MTLDRAVRGLLARQRPDGSWNGGAAAGISAVTANLLVRDLLGVGDPVRTEAAARLVRSLQCPDGYWPELPGSPADAGASVACYVVLRLAGDPPDAYPMALAAGWIRDAGGLDRSDAVTRTWLVLSGLVERLGAVERLSAPGRLVTADRLTEVAASLALTELGRHGRRRPPLGLDELGSAPHSAEPPVGGVAHQLGVRLGRSGGARWLLASQGAEGSWARRGPLSALALIALGQVGYGPEHPVVARGLDWLAARAGEATRTCDAELKRRQESAYAAESQLGAAAAGGGESGGRAEVAGGARWAPEVPGRSAAYYPRESRIFDGADNVGDARNPGGIEHFVVPEFPGGANRRGRSNSPDAEYFGGRDYSAGDGAVGLTALAVRSLGLAGLGSGHPALNRATAFLSRSGVSSGAPVRSVARARPSSDRGPQVLAAAASVDRMRDAGPLVCRQARLDAVWLLRTQRADGSWPGGRLPGSVGAASVEATSVALHALVVAGMPASKPPIRVAAAWLVGCQAPDGGWPTRGDSPAASECRATMLAVRATALAIRALTVARAAESATPAERGVRWLAAAQRPDGTWSGTGHDLAATCYAIQALTGYRAFAEAMRTGSAGRLDDRSARRCGYD